MTKLPQVVSPAEWEADNIGHLAHLHSRDTSLDLVSRAPAADRGVQAADGLGDPLVLLGSDWTFLDLTPLGRQEDWGAR